MILGCDPGLSGALAYYDGRELSLVDMPTRIAIISRKNRRVIDEEAVIRAIETFQVVRGAEFLVIEDVHGMPGQSGPAAFTFGYGVGIVTAAALAKGLKLEKVHPATWKTALGLSALKLDARYYAMGRFKDQSALFRRVKDDGRAEAALIALWGWKTRGRLTSPTDARQQEGKTDE